MIKTFSLTLDLLKVCLCFKLELSVLQDLLCKFAKLDQSKIWLNRSKLVQIFFFFCRISNLAQARMTCKVLCFALSIKRKTLATFSVVFWYCMCESLVRSIGVCLYTYLRLSRIKIMSRAWWSFQLLHKEVKGTQVGLLIDAMNPRKK